MTTEFLIIGGGIVGLAVAYEIQRTITASVVTVVEKETDVALHQSGRNSGVIHSGVYYKPGSLKATNCIHGRNMLVEFCKEHDLDFDITGKIIVATRQSEIAQLDMIIQRGIANGVPLKQLSSEEVKEIEPHVSCLRGIQVESTGITDYAKVARKLAQLIISNGGQVKRSFNVTKIQSSSSVHTAISNNDDAISARYIVNCAGLASDRIARFMGIDPGLRIIPFKGEYYVLNKDKAYLCNSLIYPVPDPNFPFLGVHLTRMIDGAVECGPNAVLAFAREGYKKNAFSYHDTAETLCYSGFQKLAARYWMTGLSEMYRSISKRAFTKAIQVLVPEISVNDLTPAPAGIRAQAVLANGLLVDDFFIKESERAIHVLNAPSPAATSCLSIAKYVVKKMIGLGFTS
jgi:(S)-2-hydroxyglutarate dehydrogenase